MGFAEVGLGWSWALLDLGLSTNVLGRSWSGRGMCWGGHGLGAVWARAELATFWSGHGLVIEVLRWARVGLRTGWAGHGLAWAQNWHWYVLVTGRA
jgi:hypothetical protein